MTGTQSVELGGSPATARGGAPGLRGKARPTQTPLPRAGVIHERDSLYRRLLAVADAASLLLAFSLSALIFGDDLLKPPFVAVPVLFVVFAKAAGLYDRDQHLLHKATLDEVPALFGFATLATFLIWLAGDFIVDGELGRRQVLCTWILLFVLLVCLRALARRIGRRVATVERCLLIGPTSAAAEVREKLAVGQNVNAELVGVIQANGHRGRVDVLGLRPADNNGDGLPPRLAEALASQEVDRVILAADPNGRDELLYSIRELKTYGVKVSVLPDASRLAGSSVELDHLHGITLLGMRRFEITRSSRVVKRAFDLLGSALALALLSPLLALAALAIRLDSPGPILFRQRRVGMRGKQFEMRKFRSMVNEAEQIKDELQHLNEGAAGLFKIADDPRVTRVGRILRRWQIDELPQLINVLRGQMSLVGPRPLIPEEDEQVEGWYRRRLDVPPGITGHWQVLGSSRRISLEEMVKLDYLYVANWSLWGDVRLLLRTVPFLVERRGA